MTKIAERLTVRQSPVAERVRAAVMAVHGTAAARSRNSGDPRMAQACYALREALVNCDDALLEQLAEGLRQ